MIRNAIFFLVSTISLLLHCSTAYPQRSSIKVYVDNFNGDSTLPAATIQRLTKLKPQISKLKIISFECYMTAAGYHDNTVIINQGALFNEAILRRLKYVRPGTTLVFDNIKVLNEQGITLSAHPLILRAL